MNKINHRILSLSALLPVALLAAGGARASTVVSSGTMAYMPVSGIPALSGWMLVVLGFLLAVMAFRVLRAKRDGSALASLVAATVFIAGAATGTKLIQDAEAGATTLTLELAQGGTVQIPAGETVYTNESGTTQRIVGFGLPAGFMLDHGNPGGSPECAVSLLVEPGEKCYLNMIPDV